MKRNYTSPSIDVVELDTDSLMQNISVTSIPDLYNPQDNSDEEDPVAEAPSYRSNLWQ